MKDLVLARLDSARIALAEAKTIQDTKKIFDAAHAAEIYAKRQELSAETIQYATEIKVEALRQLGLMLKRTVRATGGDAQRTRYQKGTESPPTLKEIGLDKKTSSLAQKVADLPEEQFEAVKKGVATIQEAKKAISAEKTRKEREKLAESGAKISVGDKWQVFIGEIQSWTPPIKYDFIITDPPYPKEFVPLYEVLARRASEWLKPNGMLVAMCGQSYLNLIYKQLSEHLDYYWTAAYLTPGQPTPLRQINVNTTWKPLLMFTRKGERYKGPIFGDVFKSDGNDKGFHKWGQSVSGMNSVVSGLCLPGQWILDPFCGAGTTGIAALSHKCLFHGLDIDEQNVNISRKRLHDCCS